MKIVSVMTTRSRGGAEFAAVELLDALVARGHETVMVSDQPAIGRDRRVRVAPIALGAKLSTTTYRGVILRAPWYLAALRRRLGAEAPYEVLLVHYKKEQLLASLLPPTLRRTLVWAEWGPVPFPLRQGWGRRLYVAASRRANLVMAISEGTRASVTAMGVAPEKVVVVPNALHTHEVDFTPEGRDRVRSALGIPHDAFVVGCISRFHPKKRNDVVVDAVKRLGDPRVHLILAGNGETEADLRARAAALDGRAHFLETPGADVDQVLSAFDVSVFCPSPTEGQPRAVILGMLARRPCLATGREGVVDMIGPDIGAIASPENDPEALASLLGAYIDDPRRRRAAGEAARRHALATYSAGVVAQTVEGLLRQAGADRR